MSKPAATAREWLVRACNPARSDWSRYVHVRGGTAYACDGRRLHYTATELPAGVYNPSTWLATHPAPRLPDLAPVLPDLLRMAPIDMSALATRVKPDGSWYVEAPGGIRIDGGHLIEAVNGSADAVLFYTPRSGEYRTMAGNCCFGGFVIAELSS